MNLARALSEGKRVTQSFETPTEPPPPPGTRIEPIDQQEGTRLLWDHPRGRIWHRSSTQRQEFRVVGHLSVEMIEAMLEWADRALAEHFRISIFYDWEGLSTYALDARLELTRWTLANLSQIGRMHLYTDSYLVKVGVGIVNDSLHGRISVHTRRGDFDDAIRADVSLLPLAPIGLSLADRMDSESVPVQVSSSLPAPSPESSTLLLPGTLVDERYRIVGDVGSGGSGSVYLAEDVLLRRKISLKLMKQLVSFDSSDEILQEARSLASIRHRNVALIHNAGIHQSAPYIAMEYVRGGDLGDILHNHNQRNALVPLIPALRLLKQVAEGLAAVHARGVIHRDVKPDNIVVEEGTERAVLVDFGLARSRHGSQRRSKLVCGTPAYLAPELWHPDGVASLQSDFYAWGVTAYELLTGRLPFADAGMADLSRDHAERAPAPASEHRPELKPLDRLLFRALSKVPENRPRSGAAIASVLGSMIEGRPAHSIDDIGYGGTLNVLLVTDDRKRAELLSDALEGAYEPLSLRIHHARNGREGLLAIPSDTAHIVVLDGLLSDMHGVEWVAQYRSMSTQHNFLEVVVEPESCDDEWYFRALGLTEFIMPPLRPLQITSRFTELGMERGWLV